MKISKFLFLIGCLFFLMFFSCKQPENKTQEIQKGIFNVIEIEFDSGIEIDSISDFQIESIDILGKIWGMMKYHHPQVTKGKYNWDYELFKIIPIVLNADNRNSRNIILKKWIKSFGRIPQSRDKMDQDPNVKIDGDYCWIENEILLGNELSRLLKKLRYAQRDSVNFYVDFSSNVKNPGIQNESLYADIIYPDTGYRLLALFRYWNIIQYYFPYRYLIGEDWSEVLPEFIPIFINAKNVEEYQISLQKLITRVNDTHACFYQKGTAFDSVIGKRYLPVEITFIENKGVVTDFFDREYESNTKLRRGDIIIKINNKAIDEIIEKEKVITPASNEAVRLRNIAWDLLRTNDSVLNLEYRKNGIHYMETIKTVPYKNSYAEKLGATKASFSLLSKDIGYIYMGSLTSDSVAFVMNELNETEGIIIDLRCYPRYFPIDELGKYLFPHEVPFAKYSMGSTINPGTFTFIDTFKIGTNNPGFYHGKIVILVNEITQSSAEFHAMAFRAAPNAIVMGSQTSGADGNILLIPLPGNIKSYITGIGIYYPDGTETQRIGIVPDIEVKPTIEGVRAGKDELLEQAIEWIRIKNL